MADEDRAWNTEDITLSEIEDLNARKRGLKDGYSGYIAKNREIKDILNGFMTQALLEKPENVFEFARKHFAGVQAEYAPQDAGTLVPLVITGTPGVGKKTLVLRLQKIIPEQFVDPLKTTSRKPVVGMEKDGETAHFVNVEQLSADFENGKYFHLEQEEDGVLTGISFKAVDDVIATCKVPVLVLPVDSYKRLAESGHYPEMHTIFIRPHEVDVLLSRLEERGTDSPEQMTQKLARAAEDMEYCKAQQQVGTFSRIVVNAAIEVALGELKDAAVSWYPHVERHVVHLAAPEGEDV